MKRNWAAIIALVLWLLFVASNAFAVAPYPPDQSIVVGVGRMITAPAERPNRNSNGARACFYKTFVAADKSVARRFK
jgi:hypothetical protein